MKSALRSYIQLAFAPFNRAHAMFVSSSALVMLFPMISAPIVARLYTPADFGIYAVFFSLATILSAISTLELRNIAFLEPTRVGGAHGALLAIVVVTLFSLGLLVVLLVLPDAWLIKVLDEEFLPYLLLLPLTVFLMGGSLTLFAWATREKEFKMLARNNLILGLATMLFQIGIGLTSPGPIGFIVANLLGLVLTVAFLSILFVRTLRHLRPSFSLRSAVTQFRKHYRLTVWMMPGTLVNSLSQFLPGLLINRFFGAALLGQYSLGLRMINMPIAFIGSSLSGFFQQQASEEFNNHGHCIASFWRFFALSLAGSLFLLLPVFLLVPYVLPIILGSQWTEAGTLIQAVAFLTVARFVSSPLSYIWVIRGRQRLDFMWQIGLLALSLGTLILPPILIPDVTLYETLWIYSLVVGAWYILAIAVSYRLSGHVTKKQATGTT